MLCRTIFALAAFLGCGPAWSQTVTYLDLSQWRVSVGDSVTASPRVLHRPWALPGKAPAAVGAGSIGVRQAQATWHERPTDVLFVRGAGTQANHDAAPEVVSDEAGSGKQSVGELPVRRLSFRPEGADTWMVGADWSPRTEAFSRSHLSSFLELHGEGWPAWLPLDKRQINVAQRESSKVLMVVPDASGRSGSSGTAMSKTAQRAQLRPLNDPCMTVPGNSLLLRLYLPEGVGLERIGIATQLTSGETIPFPFNAEGFGAATIPSAGPWLVEVHAAVAPDASSQPAPGSDLVPDVLIHTVTLAFEAPPAPPAEKAVPSKEVR